MCEPRSTKGRIMRYFEIEFQLELPPYTLEFSPNEKEMIRASAGEVDNFFDKEFKRLETLTKDFDVAFRKDDVQPMCALFEKLSREESRERESEPDVEMVTEPPQDEDLPEILLERGDSIIYLPFGKEITRDTVVHEMAHVVDNSFCDEHGVNYEFRDYFKRLETDLLRRFSETEDSMLNPQGLDLKDSLRLFLEKWDSFEKGLEEFHLGLESIGEKIDEAFATAVENLSRASHAAGCAEDSLA